MAVNVNKPQSLSEAEIQNWENSDKKKRKVVVFTFDKNDGGESKFWCVKPDRDTLTTIAEIAQTGKIGKVNEVLINSCVLAGDMEELESDDDMFFGLVSELGRLSEAKKKK